MSGFRCAAQPLALCKVLHAQKEGARRSCSCISTEIWEATGGQEERKGRSAPLRAQGEAASFRLGWGRRGAQHPGRALAEPGAS